MTFCRLAGKLAGDRAVLPPNARGQGLVDDRIAAGEAALSGSSRSLSVSCIG
jgi:hypothetical protein